MSIDELELVLARLEERSRGMEKNINQIGIDQKDSNRILTQLAKEQERMNLLELTLKNIQQQLDKNSDWVEEQTKDQLKRKNDLLFEIIKVTLIGGVGGMLASLGVHGASLLVK